MRPWLPNKKCGGPNLASTHKPSIAIIPRLANLHAIHAIEGIGPTATRGNYDSVQFCRQVEVSAVMVVCLLLSTEWILYYVFELKVKNYLSEVY